MNGWAVPSYMRAMIGCLTVLAVLVGLMAGGIGQGVVFIMLSPDAESLEPLIERYAADARRMNPNLTCIVEISADLGSPSVLRDHLTQQYQQSCEQLIGVVPGSMFEVLGKDQALLGIVPAKVTDEGGMIAVGDLLVVGSTPGHAMRWNPDSGQTGGIVGKALEPHGDSEGVIEALLT